VASEIGRDGILLINLSGRGDKDVDLVSQMMGEAAQQGGMGVRHGGDVIPDVGRRTLKHE
jgi:hypothetical protein